ncbi:MAG: hypothetical protein ABI777_01610 [Betaproteobacteria bacterium]
MRPEDFAKEFAKRAQAKGLKVDALPIPDALDLMVAFYSDVPVTGIEPAPDDALKYSWGVRYRGEGEHFEVNLSRVVTSRRVDAAPLVREMELTYRFAPTIELRSFARNEVWCYSRPELPIFVTAVRDSDAFGVAQREIALSISVIYADGTS